MACKFCSLYRRLSLQWAGTWDTGCRTEKTRRLTGAFAGSILPSFMHGAPSQVRDSFGNKVDRLFIEEAFCKTHPPRLQCLAMESLESRLWATTWRFDFAGQSEDAYGAALPTLYLAAPPFSCGFALSLLVAFWNLIMIVVRISPMQVQRLKQMGATVRNSTLYKETLEKRSHEESHLRKTFQALSTEALQATIENHRSMLALAEEVLEQRRRGLAAFSVKE
jgi:hypothetical protein